MTRRAYLYFFLTFVLGAAVGGAAMLLFGWYSGHWHRSFDRQRVVRRLARQLDLSDSQVQQLNQIMDDYAKKHADLQQAFEGQLTAIREANRNRVRQMLNPDQLAKFNEMVRRRDERMKKQRSP